MTKLFKWWKLWNDESYLVMKLPKKWWLATFRLWQCFFIFLLDFAWKSQPLQSNLLPSCCTCLWNIRKDSFIVLKLQMSQTYLTPSCSLSLCNIRSEILVALYPQMSQSSVPFAFISLELTLVIWKFPYFSKLNWEHFFYISKLFLAPGVCVWSDIIISI